MQRDALALGFCIGFSFCWAMNCQASASIEIQGHRGARALRPENTLPAFEYAIQSGVDTLELDLGVTKDGVLVVSHNPEIDPTICMASEGRKLREPILIHSLALNEIRNYDCGSLRNPKFPQQVPVPGARIPTLEEVFDLARDSPVGFNIETKIFPKRPEAAPSPAEFSRLLIEVLRKHGMLKRTTLQSFDPRTLIEARKLEPSVRISILVEDPSIDRLAIVRSLKADILSPRLDLVNTKEVAALHASGVRVIPWTANTPAEWDRLIAAGVDGIISDNPAALISYLKSKKLRP